MAEGLFDPAALCPPGVSADTLRAAVVRILPRTPLHLDIAADRETAHKLARNELQDDGSEHWFRYFTDEDRARCDDPLFALGMVNHEFCQVVKRGDAFPASVMLDGGGTGVAVSAQGHVLTNFHLATGEIERLGRNGGVLDREDFLNPDSTANKQGADEWRAKAETSPAFMWLTTANDTPSTRLATGIAYARLNLAATATGLAMHPWSQTLQEYEEMAELYAEARTLLETGDQIAQMLVRIGYAEAVNPAARRDVAAIIRPA